MLAGIVAVGMRVKVAVKACKVKVEEG